jgi:putative PIN family toxin of toxin-antitoxin system
LTIAQQHGKLVFSEETKTELHQVLAREKFEKYLSFDLRLETALSILDRAHLRKITQLNKIECRDPKDIKFLRLAWDAQVNCVISGDIHLKELNPFHNIPVLSPSPFLEWISKQKNI